MDKAEALKKITREVVGKRAGDGFYAKADAVLDEAGTSVALMAAAKKIEGMVRLFVDEEFSGRLSEKYMDFFRSNPTYL